MIYFERQKINQIRNNYLAKSVKWDIEAWSGAILEMARISNEREDLSANLAFEWRMIENVLEVPAKPSVDINTKIRIKKEKIDLVSGAWKSPPQRAREVENLTGPHGAEISWQGEITFRQTCYDRKHVSPTYRVIMSLWSLPSFRCGF